MQTTGQKIKALRMEKGMSQEDLADALKVSRQAVSKWEQDQSLISLEKLRDISRFFGVTMESMVTTDGSEIEDDALTKAKRKEKFRRKITESIGDGLKDNIVKEVSLTVEKEVFSALKSEDITGLSDNDVAAIKDNVVAEIKGDIATELARDKETLDAKARRCSFAKPSKGWIAGVTVSGVISFSFVIVMIVRAVLNAMYISVSDERWSYFSRVAWVTYVVVISISTAVLMGFVLYRIIRYVKYKIYCKRI